MIIRSIWIVIQWILGALILLLVVSLAFNAFKYFNFDRTYGFLRLKQAAINTGWYLPAYYAHVLVAGAILVVGLFQLNTRIRLKWKNLHRILGKFYAYGILFFAAPGGLVMSFFIQRGAWVFTSFILQTLCWLLFTSLAVINIRKGNVEQHRNWMWRSYALTFAAVTLRLYVFILSSSVDLSSVEAYAIIAWTSWIVNLIVVEAYLRIKSTQPTNR